MKHLFNRNKRIKVTALVGYFAHLCWPCSNDMHSINVIVLMYSVGVKLEPDINRFNAEVDAWYC